VSNKKREYISRVASGKEIHSNESNTGLILKNMVHVSFAPINAMGGGNDQNRNFISISGDRRVDIGKAIIPLMNIGDSSNSDN
jgi:hypothetical protein